MEFPVLLSALLVFINSYTFSCYVPIAAFLSTQEQMGILLTVEGMAGCAVLVPAGRAVDRLGSLPVLRCAMALMAGSLVLTSVSQAFRVQLAGRLLNGLAGSMLFNASISLLVERYKEPFRARHIGLALGVGTAGGLVGPPMAGAALHASQVYGLQQPQALAYLPIAVLLAFSCVLFLKVQRAAAASDQLEEKLVEATTVLVESQHGEPESDGCLEIFFGVYRAVGLPSLAVAAELVCLVVAGDAILAAGIVKMKTHGVPALVIGLCPVPAGVLSMVMSWWGGKHAGDSCAADGDKRVDLMVRSPIAMAIGLAGVVLASRLAPGFVALPVVVALSVASAAMAAIDAASISIMTDLSTSHGRGTGEAVTATELAVTLGASLGPGLGILGLKYVGFCGLCTGLVAAALLAGQTSSVSLRPGWASIKP